MIPKQIPVSSAFTFVSGIPIHNDAGYLILHSNLLDEDHSILAIYRNNEILGMPVATLCSGIKNYQSTMLFVGEDGQLWEFKNNNFELLSVLENVGSPLRDISLDGNGNLIIVGSLHQIYRKEDGKNWTKDTLNPISSGLIRGLDLPLYGLESVASFPKKETYAVGWGGECFMEMNNIWNPISLPTNLDLHKIICAPDSFSYICGDNGIVIRGRENRWRVIENNLTDENLWGLVFFKNRIFVSSMYEIFEIIDDSLRSLKFDTNDEAPSTTYLLTACDEVLWSIGEKHLSQFDGKNWKQLISFS